MSKEDHDAARLLGEDKGLPYILKASTAGIPRVEVEPNGMIQNKDNRKQDLGEFVAEYYTKANAHGRRIMQLNKDASDLNDEVGKCYADAAEAMKKVNKYTTISTLISGPLVVGVFEGAYAITHNFYLSGISALASVILGILTYSQRTTLVMFGVRKKLGQLQPQAKKNQC